MTNTQRPQRDAKASRSVARRSSPSKDARPIRWSKVMAAQARIASGFYDREDVRECLVEAIWHELQLN